MATAYKGIRGGTPTGTPLCSTCRSCLRVAGESVSAVDIFCLARPGNNRIKFEAFECSAYDDKRLPSRWDLEQIAWVLTTTEDGKTRQIGFQSPKERKEKTGSTSLPPVSNA